MLEKILHLLSSHRFNPVDEKQTQIEISEVLNAAGVQFTKEFRLDKSCIPDFFIKTGGGTSVPDYSLPDFKVKPLSELQLGGIAIEVKIKGSKREIFRQCERYCQFGEVTHLILVTNRSMGFPPDINGKPCYVVRVGKQWL